MAKKKMKYVEGILQDWGLKKSGKNGEGMSYVLKFLVDEEVVWMEKSLTHEKVRDFAINDLILCGLKTNDLKQLNKGKDGEALELGATVHIGMEHETWKDDKGEAKSAWRAKYINEPRSAIVVEDGDLSILDSIKGDVMAARKELGLGALPNHAPGAKDQGFDL